MIPSLSIGPRSLLNDCNHSATAIFWRSAVGGNKVRSGDCWSFSNCESVISRKGEASLSGPCPGGPTCCSLHPCSCSDRPKLGRLQYSPRAGHNDRRQAPPRVSDLATSTVFGSDPATEYLLTVRRTFSRSSMSISKTWQSGYQGYIPATLWAVGIQFWYLLEYAYTFCWN